MRTVFGALAFAAVYGALLWAAPAIGPVRYPHVRTVWLREPPALKAFPAAAQQQDPGHELRQKDPQAYCWNPETSGSQARQRERDAHGHRCSCHLACQIGQDGDVIGDHESADCGTYCVREACRCHVEEPCSVPGGAP